MLVTAVVVNYTVSEIWSAKVSRC